MRQQPCMAEGLEITIVADGSVVFDSRRDRVHYLNRTAAVVLELCTGENDTETMVRTLQLAYQLDEPPETETLACLEQLSREGLIV